VIFKISPSIYEKKRHYSFSLVQRLNYSMSSFRNRNVVNNEDLCTSVLLFCNCGHFLGYWFLWDWKSYLYTELYWTFRFFSLTISFTYREHDTNIFEYSTRYLPTPYINIVWHCTPQSYTMLHTKYISKLEKKNCLNTLVNMWRRLINLVRCFKISKTSKNDPKWICVILIVYNFRYILC